MTFLKSNGSYWNDLLAQGKLFSYVKDGAPHNFCEMTLGFAYPIILIIMIGAGTLFMVRLGPVKRKLKTYFFSIGLGTFLGGLWCCWMQKADPLFPGWLFAPWSASGLDFGLMLEDWLFLPASTTLFYCVYRNVAIKGPDFSNPAALHRSIALFYCGVSVAAFIFTGIAGRAEILLFILPAMVLFNYSRNTINLKLFLVLQLFIVVFEVAWDFSAVSLIHSIPSMAWASQWTYIAFDANGHGYHSRIFQNYSTHRWAWLIMNPIEITPLFGICGGLLNYVMFASGDKYFYLKRKTSIEKNS
jgi:hypothetical protein